MSDLKHVVLITGLSGAGKSCALKTFQDLGYFCVDNLPVPLLEPFFVVTSHDQRGRGRLALGIDARDHDHITHLPQIVQRVRQSGVPLEILFFDASVEALVRRYSETRHRHPLAKKGQLLQGIQAEQELMEDIRHLADHIFQTTTWSERDLRHRLVQVFDKGPDRVGMSILIVSFGFRNGVPLHADLVFDVRFLTNPYFVADLRPLTGLDQPVQSYVLEQDGAQVFLTKLTDLLEFLIPRYQCEGKSYLTIAIGCTGGQHRSVSLAEALVEVLSKQGLSPVVTHRDVGLRRT